MFTHFSLDQRLVKSLAKQGLSQATPVQAQAIPLALEYKDLLVSAQTGSGKTLAFLLPLLQRLLLESAPNSSARALILVPTRELARQVFRACKSLGRYTHLQMGLLIGGEDFVYQAALLRKNPEIIISTPGRLLEHLQKHTTDLKDLEVLILDEADRMLEMGFHDDVLDISRRCSSQRQTLMFSASLGHQGIRGIAAHLLQSPETLVLNANANQQEQILQQIILADDAKHKEKLLHWLLSNEVYEKALVFTKTKSLADSLSGLLSYHGHKVGVLHSDKDQGQRNRVMQLFRDGAIKLLLATDVASRGLDVKGIDLVINFTMARSGIDYLHRVGRTGRAGESGVAISLIDASEWNLTISIERYLKRKFEHRTISALIAKYKGPEKRKASGRAVGSKKKKFAKKNYEEKNNEEKLKKKQRQRNKKNVGKRRVANVENSTRKNADVEISAQTSPNLGDGLAPFMKNANKNANKNGNKIANKKVQKS